LALRRDLVEGHLQPVAMDLLNSEATHRMGIDVPAAYVMLVQISGNEASAARYEREYRKLAASHKVEEFMPIPGTQAPGLWRAVQNLSYSLLSSEPRMAVLRVSTTPTRLGEIFRLANDIAHETPVLARAGAAVGYVYCADVKAAKDGLDMAVKAKLPALIEAAPVGEKTMLEQWHKPANGIDVMRRLKHRFDPDYLLNRGRLFNQI
jgi:FAD/FMN-containing dehydrogenase